MSLPSRQAAWLIHRVEYNNMVGPGGSQTRKEREQKWKRGRSTVVKAKPGWGMNILTRELS